MRGLEWEVERSRYFVAYQKFKKCCSETFPICHRAELIMLSVLGNGMNRLVRNRLSSILKKKIHAFHRLHLLKSLQKDPKLWEGQVRNCVGRRLQGTISGLLEGPLGLWLQAWHKL